MYYFFSLSCLCHAFIILCTRVCWLEEMNRIDRLKEMEEKEEKRESDREKIDVRVRIAHRVTIHVDYECRIKRHTADAIAQSMSHLCALPTCCRYLSLSLILLYICIYWNLFHAYHHKYQLNEWIVYAVPMLSFFQLPLHIILFSMARCISYFSFSLCLSLSQWVP